MIDSENLHLLIHEEIYVIGNRHKDIAKNPAYTSNKPLSADHQKETKQGLMEEIPTIPVTNEKAEERIFPVAIFHDSSDKKDLELLRKIIDACKLIPDQYEVFANGFNKEVKFKKALVFVAAANQFYVPIPYKGGQILCSKPLNDIAANQQEKVKLWGALKGYI